MGNKNTTQRSSSNSNGVYKQQLEQVKHNFNSSLSGRSFGSLTSQQTTYSVSRPWSRVSRRRWKESTLTLPYESSKTAWPVTQSESYFLPEFPIAVSIDEDKYQLVQEISKGSFGKVYKVQDSESGHIFALKVLSKSKIISENSVHQVKEEVQIQAICGHHPFIVACLERWQTRKKLFILSNFVAGGELFHLLKNYGKLPQALVQLYVAQLALAIDFLHNAGVIYRDLKPENVLLDDAGNVQLIDFGLSKWLSYGSTTRTICGTLRYMDVDCDFIDLTYVCCTSEALDQMLKKEIGTFSEQLRGQEGTGMGQITLEFFQKKPNRWLFQPECIPWEVWTVRLELIALNSEGQRQVCREKVGELLTDKILYITEVMNRHDYLPKMPSQSELDLIFDTSYPDVQPYLFKLNHSIAGPSAGTSVGSTMKKFIKETLAL